MTTTSDARKRLAEAERIAHPATIPGAVSDAAVEAVATHFATTLRDAKAALTAALPHLHKDWEAPVRALIADAREGKRIHDVTTARTVGSDHRPCESSARLRFAERLQALLAPEVPE